MIVKLTASALLAALALAGAGNAAAAEIVRTYGSPTAFIASVVAVPAGYETVYLSGVLPDLPKAPEPAGDAQAQADSVFSKIGEILKSQGMTEGDVVSMTIYMAAPAGERMDFGGMMKAYGKYYGTPTQPNRPSRSTVQVTNLAAPGALLEVEVTAARKPK